MKLIIHNKGVCLHIRQQVIFNVGIIVVYLISTIIFGLNICIDILTDFNNFLHWEIVHVDFEDVWYN